MNGIADLFYFRNEDTDLYLLENEGGEMLALTNDEKQVYVNGTAKIQSSNRYIRLLKATFSDCMEIQPTIDQAVLNHRSLISITSDYHDYVCEGEKCIVYTKEVSKIRLKLGPVIGFSSSSLQMKGGEPFESFIFSRSNSPTFGVLLDLTSYRMNERLSFQLGAEISSNYFHSSFEKQIVTDVVVDYYETKLDAKSLLIVAGPKYAIPKGRVKPTFGGGLMFHKFIQPDFSYVLEKMIGDDVFTYDLVGDPVTNWFFGIKCRFVVLREDNNIEQFYETTHQIQ
ncbi:MAG: hypothetical protein ABFS38_05820 [Bacteroidota bacterium]